jgi:hypothetical protein
LLAQALILATTDYPVGLAISAWLDAKVKLSGSRCTARTYTDILSGFRSALQCLGLDLDSPARNVALAAQLWCSKDFGGTAEVGNATFNHRLAVISLMARLKPPSFRAGDESRVARRRQQHRS